MSQTSLPLLAHTPGPWFVTENGVNSWCIELPDGSRLATIGDGVHDAGTPEAIAANARLIAAAPELLKACKVAYEFENECMVEGNEGGVESACLHCLLGDVIAKAEGRT